MDPTVDNDQVSNVVLDELHHLVHSLALPGDLLGVPGQPHCVPANWLEHGEDGQPQPRYQQSGQRKITLILSSRESNIHLFRVFSLSLFSKKVFLSITEAANYKSILTWNVSFSNFSTQQTLSKTVWRQPSSTFVFKALIIFSSFIFSTVCSSSVILCSISSRWALSFFLQEYLRFITKEVFKWHTLFPWEPHIY